MLDVGGDIYGLFTFTAKNAFQSNYTNKSEIPHSTGDILQPRVSISAADRATDLQRWHERLGHTLQAIR